ncbi:hypothetical protein LCGC14_3001230 [marine sediment metagenome]|uniref:Uncharacterized protein n=1 Tax=marine sediment metagenome TaxID=412755 RepID=A0A0F8X1F0_9ZZZZ
MTENRNVAVLYDERVLAHYPDTNVFESNYFCECPLNAVQQAWARYRQFERSKRAAADWADCRTCRNTTLHINVQCVEQHDENDIEYRQRILTALEDQ